MTTIERMASLAMAVALAAASAAVGAQALQRERVPGVIPAAQLWDDVLAHDDLAPMMSGYDSLAPLYDENGAFAPAQCEAQSAALAQALLDNPVSLALWDAGYRCADALGDEELAEKRMLALQALLEHAMKSKPPDGRLTPIRVVVEADAMTLVEATGGTLLYSYYETRTLPRALLLVMAVEYQDGERETTFTFDFLDTMVALQRDEPASIFPTFRRAFAIRVLELMADEHPESSAAEAIARHRVQSLPAAERLAAFRGLAGSGNYGAVVAFARYCLVEEGGHDCAPEAVDLLLPLAEMKMSEPLVLLAYAQETGRGVKRDMKAAAALLAVAERRSGRDATLALLTTECAEDAKACPTSITRKSFGKLLEARDPLAQFLASMQRIRVKNGLDAKATAWLRGAAEQGVPMAQAMLGSHLVETDKPADAVRWFEAAARHGQADALASLATLHETGSGVAKDEKRALELRRRAAAAGDTGSMSLLAEHDRLEMTRESTGDEQRGELLNTRAEWLASAGEQGHVVSMFQLAEMFASDIPPDGGTRERAERLYESLSAQGYPLARLKLAQLRQLADGTPEKLAEARKLLGADVEAGNVQAQGQLGAVLLAMDGNPGLQKEGRALMRRAADGGDVTAVQVLANALARGRGGPADVREARKLWISVEDQPTHALNDRAWFECTAAAPPGFNPKSGAEAARRMRENDPQPSYLDTIASCDAANGDFDAAVRTQEQAIAEVSAWKKPPEEMLTGMRERLALYRKRERYVEALPD